MESSQSFYLSQGCSAQDNLRVCTPGADTNATDEDRKTALHWAAFYGKEAVVRMLIAEGNKSLDHV